MGRGTLEYEIRENMNGKSVYGVFCKECAHVSQSNVYVKQLFRQVTSVGTGEWTTGHAGFCGASPIRSRDKENDTGAMAGDAV